MGSRKPCKCARILAVSQSHCQDLVDTGVFLFDVTNLASLTLTKETTDETISISDSVDLRRDGVSFGGLVAHWRHCTAAAARWNDPTNRLDIAGPSAD